MIPTIRVEQDVQAVARNLERKVGLAPLFYQNAPVILDFEASEGISKERKIEREGDKEKNQQKVRKEVVSHHLFRCVGIKQNSSFIQ